MTNRKKMKLINSYIGHLYAYVATKIHRLNTHLFSHNTGMASHAHRSLVIGLLPVAFFCFSGLFTQALAQPRQDTGAVAGVELRVGDLVPDQFWQTPYRIWKDGNIKTATLAQFKDRPVILAFWMIHCGACTLNLIRMNEWAGKFGDRVAFVPINATPRDSEQEIDALLSGSTGRLPAPLTLPSVIDGERAKRFFPHVAIPHYVWIDRKQRVRAITQGYFVNQTQIETWLEHQEK